MTTTPLPQHELPARVRAQVDALFTTRRRARIDHRLLATRAVVALALLAAVLGLVITVTATGWSHGLHGSALHAWGVASRALVAVVLVAGIAMVRAWTGAGAGPLALVAALGAAGSVVLVLAVRPLPAVLPAVVGATALGFLVAGSLARVTWIVPVAIAGSVSDARSVAAGPTHALLDAATVRDAVDASGVAGVRLLDSPPSTLDLLVVHLPSISGPWVLGAIDVVVVALFLAATVNFRLPVGRSVAALAAALTVAAVPDRGVAVIPLLSAAFLLVHARALATAGRYALRRSLVHAGLR
jgi:hypothetical protein